MDDFFNSSSVEFCGLSCFELTESVLGADCCCECFGIIILNAVCDNFGSVETIKWDAEGCVGEGFSFIRGRLLSFPGFDWSLSRVGEGLELLFKIGEECPDNVSKKHSATSYRDERLKPFIFRAS